MSKFQRAWLGVVKWTLIVIGVLAAIAVVGGVYYLDHLRFCA